MELQTILLEPYPCSTIPCIDPIFGPTAAYIYWSSTTVASYPSDAWYVAFGNCNVFIDFKGNSYYVRAVRCGL